MHFFYNSSLFSQAENSFSAKKFLLLLSFFILKTTFPSPQKSRTALPVLAENNPGVLQQQESRG